MTGSVADAPGNAMHHVLLYAALFAACSAYALVRGGAPERVAALMFVAQSRAKMGEFRAGWVLGGLGWLSTAVMAAATVTMLYVNLK